MENARVYQVGDISSVTTFEDAFGDYSNASGRERRKKRKLERIEARREVKAARIAARNEAKSARQEARQGRKLARKQRRTAIAGERLAKRQQRVSARAERRGTKVGARLERRGQRTALRHKRKALRRGEPEGEMDEQTAVETGNGATQQGAYQEPARQSYQQEEETTSQQGQGQEEETQQQGGGYTTSGEEDMGYNQPVADTSNEQPSDEETSYEEQDQQDEGEAEGTDADLEEGGDENGFDGTGSSSIIDPKLLEVANKIEWNDELIDRLWDKVDESYRLGRAVDNIEKVIDAREERISQLEGELDEWCNADGLTPKQVAGRRREVEKALAQAKRNRVKATRPRHARRHHGGSETPVERELNPEFSPNKIVIPAEEKASATGLNGIDLVDDFDAPDTRIVELSSNFLGVDTKSINWGAIMAGIVIGGVAIYALKKYKVLDKI